MALGYFDFLYFWDIGGDICEDYLPCEAGVSKNEARTNVPLEKSSCDLADLLFEVEDVIRIVVVGSSVTTLARTKPRLAFSSLTWYTSLISPLISQKYQESKYPRVK